MQPIFVYKPAEVRIEGEDISVAYPDGRGTFVMSKRDGMRLAIRMLDAIVQQCETRDRSTTGNN